MSIHELAAVVNSIAAVVALADVTSLLEFLLLTIEVVATGHDCRWHLCSSEGLSRWSQPFTMVPSFDLQVTTLRLSLSPQVDEHCNRGKVLRLRDNYNCCIYVFYLILLYNFCSMV